MIRNGGCAPQLLSGLGIEGVEDAIHRRYEDLALPHSDAAIDQVTAGVSCSARIRMRIEFPKPLTGGSIDGIHEPPSARCVHDAVDNDRRRLLAPRRAEIVCPGKSEAANISVVHHRKRRKIALAPVAT
jgi:hypothetical protein